MRDINYMDHVQTDGTPESYFQFVMLDLLAGQFYLFWHALYNDTIIICDENDLNDAVGSTCDRLFGPDAQRNREQALAMQNVGPHILIGEKSVKVQVVTFTKWGGFFRQTYSIKRQFPHTILEKQKEKLIHFNYGMLF